MKIKDIVNGYQNRFKFEDEFKNKIIAGIDEVGRGALAGPIVTAAVILNRNIDIPGLFDSKSLSKNKREFLFTQIKESAVAYSVDVLNANDVDLLNVYQGTRFSMKRAVEHLQIKPEVLLIDAMDIEIHLIQKKIIKGDTISNSIAAASIIAKVTRDSIMEEMDEIYPGYSFKTNVGYGTKEHLNAIKKQGITDIHRKSFQPILNILRNK